uniref:Retrovirus-related Pol polyprotein from transposon TNT 1-94 n=1 Tax=Cannabis sativa TaxID=3483 RepID=A0A803QQI9_CANSA
MAIVRFEVDTFNSSNDFSLWRIKMKAFLVHQGIYEALDDEAMKLIKDSKNKLEIGTKAHSAILLSLGGEVLREVSNKDKAIILLSSLPKMYEHFVDIIVYGKDTLTMTEVKTALNSNEIQKNGDEKEETNGEGLLTIKGKFPRGNTGKIRTQIATNVTIQDLILETPQESQALMSCKKAMLLLEERGSL